MAVEEKSGGTQDHEHPQIGPTVTVTVETKETQVHRGSWVIAEFKKEVGVDASRALDEVIAGEFKPLDDNQRITIKGGEVFVSHARQGVLPK
jgi:hypothetical protein